MTEDRVKRKLSAILSADVAGYSRLMGEDEVSTVRTLESYRKVMSDLIEQFRGRVVDSPGDNLLSEFSSVVDAVQCAVEIHEVIRAKNEELPEDRRMRFRIGVNLGDVIEEGARIYGDGVNIAARLEGLAEAGGICISGSAHEQIENKLALGYEFLGEHTVKNIAKPVKVYKVPMAQKAATPKERDEKKTKLRNWQWTAFGAAGAIIVIIGALAIWYFSFRQASVTSDVEEAPKTIAVLPFDNLSSDPEQEYFVEGLSEEILNSLSKIDDLRVIARTSSFAFKDTKKTVQEIADALGADHVLEGSVRKSGNELRITAQLIQAVDGIHLWSDTYNRELKDVFEIQEDIATAVAKELKIKLGIDRSFKQLGGTNNEKAYELYMIAKAQYREGPQTVSRALESIDSSIELDPEFALGWALKSQIHQGLLANMPGNKLAIDNSLKAANKAIELEPNLAAGHFSLGLIKSTMCEWIEAQLAFKRALELTEPSLSYEVEHPDLYIFVGHLKRAKALYEAQIRNNPLNGNFRGLYIACLALLGDTQLAEEEYQRGKVLLGDQWTLSRDVVWGISLVRISRGNSVSSNDLPYSSTVWDIIKKNLNSPEEALKELRKIYAENNNLKPFDFEDISIWAAYYGDPALAMEALEKMLNDIPTEFFYLWLPIMKEVRQLPRFKEFIREIGLVDYWKEYGWPDNGICHSVGDDDFVCD